MLHLIMNTTAHLQLQQLCSQKHNSGNVYFTAT